MPFSFYYTFNSSYFVITKCVCVCCALPFESANFFFQFSYDTYLVNIFYFCRLMYLLTYSLVAIVFVGVFDVIKAKGKTLKAMKTHFCLYVYLFASFCLNKETAWLKQTKKRFFLYLLAYFQLNVELCIKC